ncbi:NADH:flavin oxidoreductase/NADH oxidase [Paeniglutamicibacter cryotolerans]|uniref:2,4-dienoyl-CoA reductase-like NADH-dependent reductase (Old Yellow Enzyme family) n=1 Tax=Paeniglutamicibacter cryotolerans TaxID=670079 RepID=A0A839QKI6_9MICC|nr:NADH:flavin oxidoreductase/NADH oxidase [Paeniglutamicibacter cryotolerans]MBB2995274.1 2,4-dienoyl-CoA reductase-like NADH-dependent reductase (Old Yellow Enzyme family) [Paeniglutamicibacter cryotolerans]
MSKLFEPVSLWAPQGPGLHLRNRTVLAPMCQYSVNAKDGVPHAWHLAHLGARAGGGFGLVFTEATAVSPEGRISDQDTGIWNDAQAGAWVGIVDFLHSQGAAAGIQLAHAGGKASTYAWLPEQASSGHRGSITAEHGGWETLGPSETTIFGLDTPRAMSVGEIHASVRDWVDAAKRAEAAGFDIIQIHAAHGYLIHQFLSPLTNKRDDAYGGSYENRTRYAREVVAAVREAWPAHKPLGIRFSGDDWVDGGWRIEDTVRFATEIRDLGVSAFDLSSAGIGAYHGPSGPGFQVPLATAVRTALEGTGSFVTAVGAITEPAQAEQILVTHQADGVSIGRAELIQPNWPVVAAAALGVHRDELPRAAQYWRAAW